MNKITKKECKKKKDHERYQSSSKKETEQKATLWV